MLVPPGGVLGGAEPAAVLPRAEAGGAAPAALADRRVVGVGDGLVDRGRRPRPRAPGCRSGPCRGSGRSGRCAGCAGCGTGPAAPAPRPCRRSATSWSSLNGRVLAVDVDQVVRPLRQRRLELVAADRDRRPQRDDDLAILDPLLERRGRGHLFRSSFWPPQGDRPAPSPADTAPWARPRGRRPHDSAPPRRCTTRSGSCTAARRGSPAPTATGSDPAAARSAGSGPAARALRLSRRWSGFVVPTIAVSCSGRLYDSARPAGGQLHQAPTVRRRPADRASEPVRSGRGRPAGDDLGCRCSPFWRRRRSPTCARGACRPG